MHCGYCGIKNEERTAKMNEELSESKYNLVSSIYTYFECSHKVETYLSTFKDEFQQLKSMKVLIEKQLRSIEVLEGYFEKQKKIFIQKLSNYINNHEDSLENKSNLIANFQADFERIAKISIHTNSNLKLHQNLQDYFNKEELQTWSKKCGTKIKKIQKKISQLKEDFKEERVQQLYSNELGKRSQSSYPDKDKLDLHDMNFAVLEEAKLKGEEVNSAKIKTLQNFYKESHKNNLFYIECLYLSTVKTLGNVDKDLQRNKVLLNDIVEGLKNDFKVINVFSDFEATFGKCLEEIKERSRFSYIYKRLLNILNGIINQENKRRLKFLKKYSGKIPSQIFPNLKNLCKQINLKKFYESFDIIMPIDVKLNQDLENRMDRVEEIFKQL